MAEVHSATIAQQSQVLRAQALRPHGADGTMDNFQGPALVNPLHARTALDFVDLHLTVFFFVSVLTLAVTST